MAAVKQNACLIEYIKNPSEAVQIEAIDSWGYSIEYIKNPLEELQIEAVRNLYYQWNNDNFVEKYINSAKAKELYSKLKKSHSIIT